MKSFIPFTIALALCVTPALAQKDFSYPVNLDATQTKTIKIELPEGASEVQIGSSDNNAIYVAKLYNTNGDVVQTCDQVANGHTVLCVSHVEKLALPIKIKVELTSQCNRTITVVVWVHPSK